MTGIPKSRKRKAPIYVLRLYVADLSPRSVSAISNVKRLCREELRGRHDLKVIDVYQQPALAVSEQIIATPTLVKRSPEPVRILIGDLLDRDRVLLGLDVRGGQGHSA